MKAKLIAVYGVPMHEESPYYIFRGNRAHTDPNYVEDEVWVEIPESLKPMYFDYGDVITIDIGHGRDVLSNYIDNDGDSAVVKIWDYYTARYRPAITLERTAAPA